MLLRYVEVAPGSSVELAAAKGNEAVWFVWGGQAAVNIDGEQQPLSGRTAIFVRRGEASSLTNTGGDPLRLIHCTALST